MPEKVFTELGERLLRAGVAPRHVRRYVKELADHLSDLRAEEERSGRSQEDAKAAALARLGSVEHLAQAMLEQSQLKSWSARAPWAMFGLGPLLFLGGAYLLACVYLWCGWTLFKPAADTPFGGAAGPMYGLANMYFQAGKFYYIVAPILVGWAIAVVAARQRLKAIWPMVALLLVAWMGATARIQASRTDVPHGLGHISMNFFTVAPWSAMQERLVYGLVVLTATALPYFVWRWQRTSSGHESNGPD